MLFMDIPNKMYILKDQEQGEQRSLSKYQQSGISQKEEITILFA